MALNLRGFAGNLAQERDRVLAAQDKEQERQRGLQSMQSLFQTLGYQAPQGLDPMHAGTALNVLEGRKQDEAAIARQNQQKTEAKTEEQQKTEDTARFRRDYAASIGLNVPDIPAAGASEGYNDYIQKLINDELDKKGDVSAWEDFVKKDKYVRQQNEDERTADEQREKSKKELEKEYTPAEKLVVTRLKKMIDKAYSNKTITMLDAEPDESGKIPEEARQFQKTMDMLAGNMNAIVDVNEYLEDKKDLFSETQQIKDKGKTTTGKPTYFQQGGSGIPGMAFDAIKTGIGGFNAGMSNAFPQITSAEMAIRKLLGQFGGETPNANDSLNKRLGYPSGGTALTVDQLMNMSRGNR